MGAGVGDALPALEQKLDLVDLVVYAAATWDWYRWHYDAAAARESGLPGPLVDGQMLGALLARQALEWAGPRARVRRMSFRFASMVFAGETVRCEGEVTKVADAAGITTITLTQRVRAGDRIAIDGAVTDIEIPG